MRAQQGFTLIEALLAFAVAGVGIVGAVAMAGALRGHGEGARQRAEAVRIAQAEAEWLRGFAAVAGAGRSYDAIDDAARTVDGSDNATAFLVERQVQAARGHKAVAVTVWWVDRRGDAQSVELDTVLPALDPAASALLAAPATGRPPAQPLGQSPRLPFPTTDLGDGRSAYQPAAGSAWLFDTEGFVTALCSARALLRSVADLVDCRAVDGRLLAGELRFDTDDTVDAEHPDGSAMDLDMALTTSAGAAASQCHDAVAAAGSAVRYACVVELLPGAAAWSGRLSVRPLGWDWGGDAAHFRLCRYSAGGTHPDTHDNVRGNLLHQNFLVIRGDQPCPTDGPARPEEGDLVDSSTQQHEPH